ncbi:DUF5658 family protein [Sulfitobacter sp. 915]|uniref:DUF5658 family protein n=1 Tax=Sulfitobacter sp. 915 TaxID=3368558 RepID=UPI0037464A0C
MFDLITIIAMFLVQIADVWTTNQILSRGGVELNPFIRWVMEKTGDQWSFIKVALALAVAAGLWVSGEAWAIWIITGITGIVALNNWRVLRGMDP